MNKNCFISLKILLESIFKLRPRRKKKHSTKLYWLMVINKMSTSYNMLSQTYKKYPFFLGNSTYRLILNNILSNQFYWCISKTIMWGRELYLLLVVKDNISSNTKYNGSEEITHKVC